MHLDITPENPALDTAGLFRDSGPAAGPPYRPTFRATPPYRPAPSTVNPGPDVDFQHTGIPAADAAARAGVWREVREFLQ